MLTLAVAEFAVKEWSVRTPSGRLPARSVGSYLPHVTKAAFRKFGFSTATLITSWSEIAGAEFAACTAPDRLVRLRATGDSGETPPVTLVLRVDAARALMVHYKLDQLRERINMSLGFQAVTAIRLVQVPVWVARKMGPKAVCKGACAGPADVCETAQDKESSLRTALSKLEASVLRAGRHRVAV